MKDYFIKIYPYKKPSDSFIQFRNILPLYINQKLLHMEDIQMAESLKFSGYSCRLSEKSVSPDKKNKYICYKCGSDPKKARTCQICKGVKTVQSGDALVQLLSQFLSCKLMNENCELPEIKEALKPTCSQIKQQSQLADKYIFCESCQNQFSSDIEFMYCRECQAYYICLNCFEDNNYLHQHQLNRYCVSEEEEQEQSETQPIKICQCCYSVIEDRGIYLSCENCRQKGITYEICSQCSDNKRHNHIGHIFKPSLHRAPKTKRITNPMEEYDNWLQDQGAYHKSEVYADDEQSLQSPSQFSIRKQKPLKNRHSQPMNSGNLSPLKTQNSSRVQVIIDETDSDHSSNNAQSKKCILIQGIPSVVQEDHEREQLGEETEKYIFEDYECDECHRQPENIRYHCKKCTDYDLCEKCYEQNKFQSFHFHQFDKITPTIQQKIIEERQREAQQRKKKFMNRYSQIERSSNRRSMF